METIVAVASPPGGGVRGIVRLSGPRAVDLAASVLDARPAADRRVLETALARPVRVPALVLFLRGPRSYTREDVVEIHLPGSPPLLRGLIEELCARGARPARPGEFTLRAFLNGRLDLAQAEAVEELIAASSEEEARAAAGQLEGKFSAPLRDIEQDLLNLTADVEAAIDFVDEDIEIVSVEAIVKRSASIGDRLERLLTVSATRRTEDALPVVALFGKPNAGKSTLFNRLTGGDAIVSDVPGTTRDVLEAEVFSYRLVDAAGQRDATGVENEAVVRAQRAADSADLILWVVDATDPDLSLRTRLQGRPHIIVLNKIDLISVRTTLHTGESICASAKTGEGVEALRALVRKRLERDSGGPETRFFVTLRQQALLRGALDAVRQAREAALAGIGTEFVALDLREGLAALGAVTGRNVTDDLLSRIFERFCLGK